MVVWALAKKEARLLLRDRLSAAILLVMPFFFILVLGLLLGEGFGQKADDRLRVSLVDLDEGPGDTGPFPHGKWSAVVLRDLRETADIRVETITTRAEAERLCAEGRRAAVVIFGPDFSRKMARCSFLQDGINPFHRDGVYLDRIGVEVIRDPTQTSAASIIDQVVQVTLLRVILPYMIGQAFTKLSDEQFIERLGEAVRLPVPENVPELLDTAAKLFADPRVRLARLTDRKLDARLKKLEEKLKVVRALVKDFPELASSALELLADPRVRLARRLDKQLDANLKKLELFTPLLGRGLGVRLVGGGGLASAAVKEQLQDNRIKLAEMIRMASGGDPKKAADYRGKIGTGVQEAIGQQFSKYDLTGMTWADLTRSRPLPQVDLPAGTVGLLAGPGGGPLLAASSLVPDRPTHPALQRGSVTPFRDERGTGLLRRGAARWRVRGWRKSCRSTGSSWRR